MNYCAAGKTNLEYSRYTLKKISLSEQEGEMRRRQKNFTDSVFVLKSCLRSSEDRRS
jgi:hypothetical protein